MPKKRHKPEEIVAKLGQVGVLASQGRSVADAIRPIGVSEVSDRRWRREFGGLKSDRVKRMKAIDVLDVLSDLFILRGVPEHVRSDNGPEFVAKAVQGWISAVGAKTACIAPGSPWRNGFIESFNARGCATNSSTARSSAPSPRRRSSSNVGGGGSMQVANRRKISLDDRNQLVSH